MLHFLEYARLGGMRYVRPNYAVESGKNGRQRRQDAQRESEQRRKGEKVTFRNRLPFCISFPLHLFLFLFRGFTILREKLTVFAKRSHCGKQWHVDYQSDATFRV